VLAETRAGLRIRTKDGREADVQWRRFADMPTGRLLLGFGHALTIDAAQGITSDEHINALPRGTSGVTAFTAYVAESRSRGTTWTVISEAAVYEAEKHRQALGDETPITKDDLWARVAQDMSEKPYKALGIDLLFNADRLDPSMQDWNRMIDAFIATNHLLETAQRDDPRLGVKAAQRIRAAAVNDYLARHLPALDAAIKENGEILGETLRAHEVAAHRRTLRPEPKPGKSQLNTAAPAPKPSTGPGF